MLAQLTMPISDVMKDVTTVSDQVSMSVSTVAKTMNSSKDVQAPVDGVTKTHATKMDTQFVETVEPIGLVSPSVIAFQDNTSMARGAVNVQMAAPIVKLLPMGQIHLLYSNALLAKLGCLPGTE